MAFYSKQFQLSYKYVKNDFATKARTPPNDIQSGAALTLVLPIVELDFETISSGNSVLLRFRA